jgi:mRNA interferase MazF
MVVNRFDVYLIELDPAIGSEIKKQDPVSLFHPMK